ncbi:MAG: type II toxin-antitoxin system VapC family toxin [Pseudonocardiaceae bacterium]
MLVYVDSSVLARAYLPGEEGHAEAAALLAGTDHLLVTATWTIVEVTSTLVRATRVGRRGDIDALLAVLAADTGKDGTVTLLRADTEQVELRALQIVREHALQSLDAMHLAVATLAAVPLLDPGDSLGLASRDKAQRQAGIALGFVEV